jgi:hypothetical protein
MFMPAMVWSPRRQRLLHGVIELQSRRVHVAGSTRYPDEAFVVQAMRESANAIDGFLADGCVLICDGDRKWSRAVLAFLDNGESGRFGLRFGHPTATRMRSGSFGRSRKYASIE